MSIENRNKVGRDFIDFAITESIFDGIIGSILKGF